MSPRYTSIPMESTGAAMPLLFLHAVGKDLNTMTLKK
jgi:hypothetical protein